jgi:hypothetical protein
MASWIASEGTRAAFNPLAVLGNPDAGELGWTEFNASGVTNFTSYEQGLEYNVRHMTKHGVGVINALKNKSNNPYDIATSIENAYFQGSGSDKNTLVRQNLQARHIPEPSGDPVGTRMSGGGGGGGNVSLSGGHTFNINPTINVSGGGTGYQIDMQKIAHEIAVLTRRELELEMLRSN